MTSGCASIQGYPEPAVSAETRLAEVKTYLEQKAVTDCASSPTRTCRNTIMDARLTASDVRFSEFERALYMQGIGAGVGTDWGVLALNSVATFAKKSADELAAISAAVVGGRASYEKQALYDSSLPVMIAQMVAKRQEVLVSVRMGQTKAISEYSLYRGLSDVDQYDRAGSIPAAMSEIVRNAGEQAAEASDALKQIDAIQIVEDDVQVRREAIAVKLKAAQTNELMRLLKVSGKRAGDDPLVDALNMLSDATTNEQVDTLCARLALAAPSTGGC